MKYQNQWNKIIGEDEVVKHEFSISSRYLKIRLAIWIIVGFCCWIFLNTFLGGIMIVAIAAIIYFYRRKSPSYVFTDKRIVEHVGLLSTKVTSIDYKSVSFVEVEEPFLGRLIYKTGFLLIGYPTLKIKHVEHPYELKKKLDTLRSIQNVNGDQIVGNSNYSSKEAELNKLDEKYKHYLKGGGFKELIKELINPLNWIPGVNLVKEVRDDRKNNKTRSEYLSERKKIIEKYK